MENRILEFKKALNRQKECQEEYKEYQESKDPKCYTLFLGTHIRFNLNYEEYGPGLMQSYSRQLFTLDEEDINYLKNKYLPKLQEELEISINKLKEEYGK